MEVRVRSPARLHLGIIDPGGTLGRKYGSIGVAIDAPCVVLRAKRSPGVVVACEEGVETPPAKIRHHTECVLKHFEADGGVEIRVERDIPRNAGLGSTTQMALSVATAVKELYGIETTVKDLSLLLGRGQVSGIGTAAFERGGFIVDGGTGPGEKLPTPFLRMDFPKEWIFVVAIPRRGRGLTEKEEKKVFKKISARPENARKISHLLVMKMLPSLVEEDIEGFGGALTEIQRLVGKTFSRYQAGIFHSKASETLVKFFLEMGAYGAGQSSWGPTVYGLVKGKRKSEDLKSQTEDFLEKNEMDWFVRRCVANNTGALIKRFER